jgi:phage baseplate assembly protein V
MRGIGHLQNTMRLQAMMQESGKARARYGIVSSFDPKRYCAKVKLQPSGKETGWLPVGTPWAGNGWGLFAPPPIGTLVKLEFPEGVTDVGVITASFYNDQDRPLSVEVGEIWLVHEDGAYLKLTNDGKVLLQSAVEIDIGDEGAVFRTLVTDAFVALFNSHTQQVIGGVAQAPTVPMTQEHLTSTLKGN